MIERDMPKLGETQRRDWADLRDVKTCAHQLRW